MDSITHIAIGACIGEAILGKRLGKAAMLWGAMAQSAPDIDFIASAWLNTTGDLLAHRGFTHSILFSVMLTPLLALAADRWHRPHNISFKAFLLFFFLEVTGHIFLDGFNAYGVGWLEPFSHTRFSFNAIFVADPLFSIWPAIACIALIFIKHHSPKWKFWWRFGIFTSLFYLCICISNKLVVNHAVKNSLRQQHIVYNKYFSTPTALNSLLWFIVAGNDSGFYIGYRSVFDKKTETEFRFFPKNDFLLNNVAQQDDIRKLKRFSQGFYTVEKWHDTLVFNDLRFGQIAGWKYPDERFVFHYFVQQPSNNRLVVQRGRFAKWDKNLAQSMILRIAGK
jgi:inner membrane protein